MIYLVISSFGEYDERRVEIDSAWYTPEGADARIKEIEVKFDELRAIPMPEIDSSNMSQEMYDAYMEWNEKTEDAREYNNSWVQEMQVQ
jgi:hypothetical protein